DYYCAFGHSNGDYIF
nr:immunoglobulin light chain junction region [Macaca mulatta]